MRRLRSKDGSTLIEALVAITIFAATASAAFSMLAFAVTTMRENELNAYAASLAVQEREDLRSMSTRRSPAANLPAEPADLQGHLVHGA